MNPNEIADKIEQILTEMFADSQVLQPRATEYSILHNPQKHPAWFIALFFETEEQLQIGLKQGNCYKLYMYLTDAMAQDETFNDLETHIRFESDNRPTDTTSYDRLLEKYLTAIASASLVPKENETSKVCNSCGHDFNKHQLLGEIREGMDVPTEGWIICPEEGCNCFMTWSANYKGDGNMNE
ncbi:hypothetical protein BKI52_25710 [marine bacterium AO1-C]|nr:hypothetical protein BKI52_25710 [marine bacterium AO1-C]